MRCSARLNSSNLPRMGPTKRHWFYMLTSPSVSLFSRTAISRGEHTCPRGTKSTCSARAFTLSSHFSALFLASRVFERDFFEAVDRFLDLAFPRDLLVPSYQLSASSLFHQPSTFIISLSTYEWLNSQFTHQSTTYCLAESILIPKNND